MFGLALPVLKMPWFIKKYQKNKPVIRHLTAGEITLAKTVFSDLLDYTKVRIINYPYIPWQGSEVFIAPNGQIFVGDIHYKDDYSLESPMYQQVFIHEMAHVLQHQQGVFVLLHGAYLQSAYYLTFKKYNPYFYHYSPDKNFWDYNIEQQGKIAEDIYLGKIPNIIKTRQKL